MEDRAEYFSIAQVADMLGVTKETLRRWDDIGTLVAQRDESNNYRVVWSVRVLNLFCSMRLIST